MKKKIIIAVVLIIIVVLGISALIILPKISLAFNNNSEEIYQDQKELYLNQAKKYGEDNIEKLKENENTLVMSVEELQTAKYIGNSIYENEDNPNNNKNLKIKITYNEEDNKVTVEYV